MLYASALLLASVPVSAATPKPTPTPTPKEHKLSGGFGRGAPDAVVAPPGTVTPEPGQSLADAVRSSSATKKKKGSISITNETLVTDPKKGKLTTAAPRKTPAAATTPAASKAERPADAEGTPPQESAEAEAYWRERMHSAKTRVEDLEERVRRYDAEAHKLENDFYSWDDGNYRDGVIKPAWDKKREELETARRELAEAQKELAELPEKARKAGALPGWLRD
jgi:predicted RNase H-like nuclease (RuvC/YqgF family)